MSEENFPLNKNSEGPSSSSSADNKEDDDEHHDDSSRSCEPLRKKLRLRREELSHFLKDSRNSKSIKKATFQDKMLNLATEEAEMRREDIKLKKRLVDLLETSEKQFSSAIQKLPEDLNRTMADGFNMMRMMFQPNQQVYPAYNYYQGHNMANQQNTKSEDNSDSYYIDL